MKIAPKLREFYKFEDLKIISWEPANVWVNDVIYSHQKIKFWNSTYSQTDFDKRNESILALHPIQRVYIK